MTDKTLLKKILLELLEENDPLYRECEQECEDLEGEEYNWCMYICYYK